MSTVYLARDLKFSVRKTIAIKEMVNRARDDLLRTTAVTIFEREANILASLSHPSVPKIYDYFTIENQSYLIMEYIEGQTLDSIITKSAAPLPEAQISTWAIELCNVLDYLHNHKPQPIIFRDMKPANIMITPDGHIVLVDFGIAKVFQAEQKGTMVGTEGYSPPEQYRGEATPAVDVYALGATLHHALTKKDPRIETPFTFSERPITQINPSVSYEMETVVNTALQYNAADRYKDISSMRDALIAIAQKTGALRYYGRTDTLNISTSINPSWIFECEDEIRGSPTYHDEVIYIGSYDNNLYALKSSNGEFIWKYPTDGGIVSKPVVYEKSIYFGSEDNRLHVISTHSGRVVWTYYADGPIRSSPRISDRHVFFGSDDSNLHIVNAMTGRRALRMDLGAPIRSTPLVYGEYVYVGTENGDFFCIDFQGRIKWRARAKRGITSSPSVADDIIYYGSIDGFMYAMDVETGWGVWRFRMMKGTVSSPTINENYVYFGSADEHIYCIDTRTSKEIWRYKTDHQISSSPYIHHEVLFCGGVDNNMYCLDRKTGNLIWKFPTGDPITGSPIVHDDQLFFGSCDHKLYAVKL
jgi:serine/threonine protein kinase